MFRRALADIVKRLARLRARRTHGRCLRVQRLRLVRAMLRDKPEHVFAGYASLAAGAFDIRRFQLVLRDEPPHYGRQSHFSRWTR